MFIYFGNMVFIDVFLYFFGFGVLYSGGVVFELMLFKYVVSIIYV